MKRYFEITPEQRGRIQAAATQKLRTLSCGLSLRLLRRLANWACYHDSRLMYWVHGYQTASLIGWEQEVKDLLKV